MRRAFLIVGALAVSAVVFCARVEGVGAAPHASVAPITDDAAINAILTRSCQDCHSDKTAWPWYSHIPPVGAAIRKDVAAGRAMMDLSRWNQYDGEQKNAALAEIAALVRNGLMPPERYTFLHPGARLSAGDIQRLTQWTIAERRRLRAASESTQAKNQ